MYLIKTSAIWGLGEIFFVCFWGKIAGHLRSTELHICIVNEGSSLLKIEVFH